jgi:DNA repair protein RecN (Recombination protein N)
VERNAVAGAAGVAAPCATAVLRALAVRDFVIVDRLDLEFDAGFSALTGETGAGKSILIDALGLLLGGRAEAGVVRAGCERAELSAEFDVGALPAVSAWLREQALDGDEPESGGEAGSCLLRRVIDAGGRSRSFINGRSATVAQLRELGEHLVDIHGQHSHQSLGRAAEQRTIVDGYAGHGDLVERVAQAWRQWQGAHQACSAAERDQAALAARREELQWQCAQLAELAFDAEAWQAVNAEHARLGNAAALIESAEFALEALGDGESAALSHTGAALARLRESAAVDREADAALELVAGADAQIKEAVRELRHYRDRLDIDPQRLRVLDARIEAVQDAARRFRVPPAELGELQLRLAGELEALGALADVRALAAAEAAARSAYREAAAVLRKSRERAADRLGRAVSAEMQALAMAGGRFEVKLVPLPEPAAGEPQGAAVLRGSRHGDETIEFHVAINPGSAGGPLAAVASGGELSRISLALRKVTSTVTRVPVLIFDEVDNGIGGAVAEIVGRMLRDLGRTRQVMCVTHLPQVAASAGRQFQVSKQARDGQTVSRVERLDAAGRIEELARMLGGVQITATTRRHAEELLQHAHAGEVPARLPAPPTARTGGRRDKAGARS